MNNELETTVKKVIEETKALLMENQRLAFHLPVLLLSFFLSVAISCEGDFTLFSSNQLVKMLMMMVLLAIAFQLGLATNQTFKSKFTTLWQQDIIYYLAVNASFIPLLILSRSHQGLALEIPLLTFIFSMSGLAFKHVPPFFKNRTEPRQEEANSPQALTGLVMGKTKISTVLINGLENGIAEHLLPLLATGNIQTLVLMNRQGSTLEAWRYWLRQFHPHVTVITALSDHMAESSLKTLFATYKPQLVFDLDRTYFASKADGSAVAVASTNLHTPRLIIEHAIKYKAKAVVTLTPHAQDLDNLVYNCQVLHEGYAQKMDSAKTRIIPIRSYPLSGDTATTHYFTQFLKLLDYNEDILVSDSKMVAKLIIDILNQLFANPAHHGSVWAVTAVKKIKAETIHRLYGPELILTQFERLVAELIIEKKTTTQQAENWLSVSLPHLAIINDSGVVEADFEDSLTALSEALQQKNDVNVATILQVA